jgi:hypothetical protein
MRLPGSNLLDSGTAVTASVLELTLRQLHLAMHVDSSVLQYVLQ